MSTVTLALLGLSLSSCGLLRQTPADDGFARGLDVSEARAAEAAGVQFRDTDGSAKSALAITKAHGYGWIRVRLMIDPSGQYGLNQDLPYVKAVMQDAHTRGLKVLLDLHYSDWWADPGNQWVPARWKALPLAQLQSAVYDYTKDVITQLRAQGTPPDMVQIGNEINGGLLWEPGRIVKDDMGAFVSLTNAGANAVRDASSGQASMPPIMVHIAKIGDAQATVAWYKAFVAAGGWVDTIGLSYYPMWHGDFDNLSRTIKALRSTFSWAKVYVAETAYYWDQNEVGTTTGLPYPQTRQGQTDFLKALTPVVKDAGGSGIFYWGAFWSQSSKWLSAPGWKDDDASRRSLFDDAAQATPAIDALK